MHVHVQYTGKIERKKQSCTIESDHFVDYLNNVLDWCGSYASYLAEKTITVEYQPSNVRKNLLGTLPHCTYIRSVSCASTYVHAYHSQG